MIEKETKRIMGAIKAIWPNFSIADTTVQIWFRVLEPLTYEEAHDATMAYMRSSNHFPPTPGHLFECVRAKKAQEVGDSEGQWQAALEASSMYKASLRVLLRPLTRQLGARIGWDRIAMADTQKELPWIKKEFIALYEGAINKLSLEQLNDEAKMLEMRVPGLDSNSGGNSQRAVTRGPQSEAVQGLLTDLAGRKATKVEAETEGVN